MRLLLLALILTACAPPPATTSRAPAPAVLAGTNWLMVIDGPSETAPTLEFGALGGRASGFTGCNEWFAQVDRRDGGLRFEAIGMTRRVCDAPAMALERELAEQLAQTRSVQLNSDSLALMGEDGVVLARFTRAR